MKAQQVYERVTQNIIDAIESGNLPPWLLPFKRSKRSGIIPVNTKTGAHYNGTNILTLWFEREAKQYASAEWLTYKQCQELGGQVRYGEKATPILYVNKTVVKDEKTEEERLVPYMKVWSVFNVAQCEGLPHNEPPEELPEHERNERAEAFFAAIGSEIRWGEPMAAYFPSKDCLTMPHRGAFHSAENLYATWAHEEVHRTGHPSRLNRELKSRFDQQAYAFEELVAELGSAFVCAQLEIQGELRHASYVDSWLKVLKQDSRAIVTAASHASKATDYLLSFSRSSQKAA